jgi:hypothetical protein
MNETSQPLIFRDPPLPEALLPAPIPWLWITLGAALVILFTITTLIRRHRRKSIDPSTSRRLALEQALREIDEASSLAPRLAAVHVSLAIRRYLSTAASDPSLFETHEEFLSRHPSLTHWPADTIESLISTLKHLAEIKYRPLPDELSPSDLVHESRSLLLTLDGQSAA